MTTPPQQYPREAMHGWLKSNAFNENATRLYCEIVDILFFASLGREEGQPARVHVIYHPAGIQGVRDTREAGFYDSHWGPQPTWNVIPLEPRRFTAKALVKLTPAIKLERTAVIVGPHHDTLHIVGLGRRIEDRDGGDILVFSAPEPGCIVVSRAGEEVFRYERGKYENDKQNPAAKTFALWDALTRDGCIKGALENLCLTLIDRLPTSVFGMDTEFGEIVRVMQRLIETMASTGHGGIIAVQPGKDLDGELAYPFPDAQRTFLSDRIQEHRSAQRDNWSTMWEYASVGPKTVTQEERLDTAFAQGHADDAKRALDSIVESIGHLTAIDNALLLGPDLTVFGAGHPISTDGKYPQVYEANDLSGTPGSSFDLKQHGSRHRAAACFAHQHPGGLIFMVSQDGPLRCMLRPVEQSPVLLWNLRLPLI